ncbi:MAG: BadF/BadG/BcrA/BcrD ATPase family protein, partial [bacterium]
MAYYAGIDVGSLATKCVVINDDGRAAAKAALPTGVAGAVAARKAFDEALAELRATEPEVARVVGTGYGRARVPFADRAVTEIMCHARGAFEHVGGDVTVVDVGGQDVK